jgi:hypothetical protein
MTAAEPSIFWDQLIELIDETRVIPVVGQDLLTIPTMTGQKLLYPYIAERLAKYLSVSPDSLPKGGELNEVACRYITICKSKGKSAQGIYAALKTIAAEIDDLPVPEPLLQLAEIRPFQLFVTTTFDSCLIRALNQRRFGGNAKTHVFTHAPDEAEDLPCDLRSVGGPVVYHLMGKLSATPAYVVTQEDLVEFFHSLQSATRRPSLLFDELNCRSLLILGSRFPGWLTSFFMRMTKRQRLSSNERTDYVADDVVNEDESLVLFLERFSSSTEIFRQAGAVEFVRELHKRWTERHPPTPVTPAAFPSQRTEFQPGAIFLSYAKEDHPAVQKICDSLEESGLDVFLDRKQLDPRDDDSNVLHPGDEWEVKLRRRISQCSLFIPIISGNSLGPRPRRFLRAEWRAALKELEQVSFSGEGNFLLPVVIDDTKEDHPELPPEFTRVQWVTLRGGEPTPAFVERVKELYRKYQLQLNRRSK